MLQTHVNNDIYNKYCLIHNKFNKLLVLNINLQFLKAANDTKGGSQLMFALVLTFQHPVNTF